MTCSVFYGEVIRNRASNFLSLLWILTGRNEAYIIFYTDSPEGMGTLSSGVVMGFLYKETSFSNPQPLFIPSHRSGSCLPQALGLLMYWFWITLWHSVVLIFCSLSSAILMTFLALRERGWTCLIRTFFQLVILWLNQCQILQAIWMLDWSQAIWIFFFNSLWDLKP